MKEFDDLLSKKQFKLAEKRLRALRGLKKWQVLNLESLIAYKKGEWSLAEDYMRQSIREPDCKVVVNRNLAGLLINQGRMAEALQYAEKAYKALKDLKIRPTIFEFTTRYRESRTSNKRKRGDTKKVPRR